MLTSGLSNPLAYTNHISHRAGLQAAEIKELFPNGDIKDKTALPDSVHNNVLYIQQNVTTESGEALEADLKLEPLSQHGEGGEATYEFLTKGEAKARTVTITHAELLQATYGIFDESIAAD